MPAAGLRLLSLLCVVLVAVSLASAALARHGRHHYGRHWHGHDFSYEDRVPQPRDFAPGSAPAPARGSQAQNGGFVVAVAQVIHACSGQAAELEKMPLDAVVKTVQPNDAQRAALEQIRAAATDAANKLNTTCPKDVPALLTDRLNTMRASLDAIKAALVPLRPGFVDAYAALSDEQKARLVALTMSRQAPPVQPGAPGSEQGVDSQPQPVSLGCRQWPAMLKNWPLNRIESNLALSDDQHAALYVMMAAIYRAAGGVAASCHDETALTPVARLDAELKRVDVLRQCIDAIAPALTGFANSLNSEQNAQLNAALGLSPQSATIAR
jgi:hypothetical protein